MDQTRSSWREEAVLQMTFDVKQRRRGLFTPTKGEGFGSRGAGQLAAGSWQRTLTVTADIIRTRTFRRTQAREISTGEPEKVCDGHAFAHADGPGRMAGRGIVDGRSSYMMS